MACAQIRAGVASMARRWHRLSTSHGGGRAATIDLRAAAMPIIIKTAGFDVSPIERWQIRTPLRAVT